MPIQNVSYSQNPAIAVAGMLGPDSVPRFVSAVIVESAIAAGLAVLHGATTKTEGTPPSAPTADVDAILATGGASAATAQTISGASLDGVVGQGAISPAKNITLTLSNHADWDATTAVVTGEDEEGAVIEENFTIPNGGNATVTGSKHFSKVTSIYIPAQSGTGGTFTAGTGVKIGAIDSVMHGVSVWDGTREPGTYAVDELMPVIRRGPVWVYAEAAVDPSKPVFVRFVAGAGETLGRFRGAADSTDCGRLRAARWLSTTSGEGFALLDLNLP